MTQTSPQPPRTILVVDDHELYRAGTILMLEKAYPDTTIQTAQTAESAMTQLTVAHPNLPDLVVLDLGIPQTSRSEAKAETGITLLKTLMQAYPTLNLAVMSVDIKPLIRVKPDIDSHLGGFSIITKNLSSQESLKRVQIAVAGGTHTNDIKGSNGIELRPEWLKVLKLAFDEELQDEAIAKQMNVSKRTVRHYWEKIYDAFEIYSEEQKNLRVQTGKRARERGLID